MNGITHNKFSVAFGYIGLVLLDYFKIVNVNFFIAMPIMIVISQSAARIVDYDLDWHNIRNKTALAYIINKIIHITGGKHRSWQTHSLDINLLFIGLWIWIKSRLIRSIECNAMISLSKLDIEVLNLIIFSFWFGWSSHLFADALNGMGIRLLCSRRGGHALVPKKVKKSTLTTISIISFVIPAVIVTVNYFVTTRDIRSILMLSRVQVYSIIVFIALGILLYTIRKRINGKELVFKTGEEWEAFVQNVIKVVNIILGIGAIVYGVMKSIR